MKKIKIPMSNNTIPKSTTPIAVGLLADLRQVIDEAKKSAAVAVNATLSMMYWRIGKRIREEILGGERAEYGKEILSTLSAALLLEFGRGFEEKNLRRMLQFAEVFDDEKIVASLMRQLSWTHFLLLIPIKNQLQRKFYIEMCCIENWSVRTLRGRIDSMLYERTALSRKPDALISEELDALRQKSDLTPALVSPIQH